MQVVRGRQSLAAARATAVAPADRGHAQAAPALVMPAAVAIGNFDGVHKGHQALVATARAHAVARGGDAGVVTFDPHPSQFFAPGRSFPLLLPLNRRLELLGEAGASFALVEPFDAALAAMSPEEFARAVLVDGLGVKDVVVGYDFCFGRKRSGNAETLRALGANLGFGVTVVPPVEVDGIPVSSTKVRDCLAAGRVDDAAALLGRPPEITGRVVRGAGRGRSFGVPTANLAPEVALTLATGIYAARARFVDSGGHQLLRNDYMAAVSVGTNPTFAAGADGIPSPITVEAYLLDYPGEDLYGAKVRLSFVQRLREERRFDSIDALKAEIDRDIARTRALLETLEDS